MLALVDQIVQSYDYTLDKIKIYTRVPLGDIVSITKGNPAYDSRRSLEAERYSRRLHLIASRRSQP
jgi:hypothetical protein